ncbi:hypothetical protein P43SY_008238 [Pythium insidiosum]|uniref:Uncharacterized protein n=1 Tax=Pythium insidiosum TaxID=114742 RepID=A0AAD5LKY8_PYTIN|nr:hypothetical protein P43SY_008238 [Pythium insidiosum]
MTQRSPPRQHAPSPSFLHTLDMPLSLSAMAQVLRDAEHLTARYGSTAAACARLDELERAHVELQAQLGTLQQKLSMAMVAAAAAQVDQAEAAPGGAIPALDVDGLLTFLQRHSACRGDLALLVPLLHDYMHSQVAPPETRFPPRDILISVHEIRPMPTEPQPHQGHLQYQALEAATSGLAPGAGPSHSPPQPPASHRDRAMPSPGPRAAEITKKRKTAELSRMTPKANKATPASSTNSSPARGLAPVHSQSAIAAAASAARLAAAAAGQANGASAPKPPQQPAPQQPAKPGRSALKPHNTRRARQEQKQAASAAVTLSAMAIARTLTPAALSNAKAKASADATPDAEAEAETTAETETDPADLENNTSRANAPEKSNGTEDSSATGAKRTRVGAASSHELVVKQNLFLPHDKRNIVELKHSSSFLTLEALEALNRAAPWDAMYKQRALFSHILDVASLDDRAAKWFIGALRVQFVWRREFWERLHWLAMSETVCVGAGWEKYRQTRKRRANKAIAAWRKVYGDSLELMKLGLLPEDVWCDVALWYMPPTPLYWLPNSGALDEELEQIDAKHPVRCYHVQDLTQHPFYQDEELPGKYPKRFELPSPQVLALQNEDKESRVNITPE